MATGTNLISAKYREGDTQTFVGKFTAASSVAGGEAIEFDDALPDMGGVTILEGSATFTGTVAGNGTLGTSSDADGIVEASAVTVPGSMATANGDLVGTVVTDTQVVFETSGTINAGAEVFVTVTYGCGDFTFN